MTEDATTDRRSLVKALAAGAAAGLFAGCTGTSSAPESDGSGSGESGGSGGESTDSAETTASSGGGTDSGTGSGASSFGGWMENVGNYDGVVDETGSSEVTVEVGAQGNGGGFAFAPAAVKVDAGTTVVWKWTGSGGQHNVVAEDGSFESELSQEKGHTFEHAFEESGTYKYACEPHRTLGMKGVVVVE